MPYSQVAKTAGFDPVNTGSNPVTAVFIFGGDSMVSEIIVAGFSLIGTFIGSFSGMKLMSYRIEQLEKKVERHNNFAERIPILEEKILVANHRINDLETHEHEREVNGA